MTTTPAAPAPATAQSPFHYLDDADGGPPWYVVYIDSLPEVRVEAGTGAGHLTFRTPNGALAVTGISTSERLFAAAAESLALAHAVAAYEDAQRDSKHHAALDKAQDDLRAHEEPRLTLVAALADPEGQALVQAIIDRKLNH